MQASRKKAKKEEESDDEVPLAARRKSGGAAKKRKKKASSSDDEEDFKPVSGTLRLTHACPLFQHLLSERLTSLGIMGAPRVPPLIPSETILL